MRRNKATRSGLDMSSTRFLLRKPCLPHQKHQTDLNFYSGASIRKGASIKYVRAEGEGGVGPNADVVLRLSKRGCVNLRTRGGRGGQKSLKICVHT